MTTKSDSLFGRDTVESEESLGQHVTSADPLLLVTNSVGREQPFINFGIKKK